MDDFKIALNAETGVMSAVNVDIPVIVRWQGVEIKINNAWHQRRRERGKENYEVIMEGEAE